MVGAENESLSDADLSPIEMEEKNPRPPPPLMPRVKELIKRARTRKKSGKRTKSSTMRDPPPPATLLNDDDEISVASLPEQHGCGSIPWDWSHIHKYGGKAFLDLTGLSQDEGDHLHNAPVQSISSLDSDADALPLIIGEDAHDSESDLEPERIPPKHAKRKPSSIQKDVPVVASTSRHEADLGHRTLTQKYRPKSFREIVGQGVVVKSLSIAIMKAKVAPMYLFMGPRGTGKTSAARVFAAGLNCLLPDSGRRPCWLCHECGTMALNRSVDVRQIDASPDVDLQSMRAMMGSFTPRARYKVFIVEGCDLLSVDIWNAFLKILEEPPRNVVFILIATDVNRIAATATPRCQKFLFSKLKESDMVKRLELLARKEGLVMEAGVLTLIAAHSDGSLRDAEIILDQLCLLDKNVTVALFQELVGILPDHQILDLLDCALSANTVNTVRTLRELLNSGVEPLALVSQLGSVITDILVGSLEINRDARSGGFFSRNISAKEEQHRLRMALKILSETEKQLRVVTVDRATWLTAALLQFAPDRSFLPSPDSQYPSPIAPEIVAAAVNHPVYDEDASEPEEGQLAPSLKEFVESKKNPSPDPSPEDEEDVITVSEQKLAEAWVGELPPPPQVDGGEVAAELQQVEFQVFQDEALVELWMRVVMEVTSRNLKSLLQTYGRLVAAGVAVDGSCAVVELEFDYACDKHEAERSWRSICIAFQAVLCATVELRIELSETAPDEAAPDEAAARTGETMVDMEPSPSAQAKGKEVMDDPHPDDAPPASSRARPRRRGYKVRRHRRRHSSELVSSSDPSGITPRIPPSRTRRMKCGKAAVKPITPTFDIESASTSFTREVWESITGDRNPEKKALSTHMEVAAKPPPGKEVMDDPHPDDGPPASSRARPRRRGHKVWRHHRCHSSELVSSSDHSGITLRRPPSQIRRVKRGKAAVKPITPTLEVESASTSFTCDVWNSISEERNSEKKALSTHIEVAAEPPPVEFLNPHLFCHSIMGSIMGELMNGEKMSRYKLNVQHGISKGDLQMALSSTRAAKQHKVALEDVLQVMDKMELCFEQEDGTIIVPLLLSNEYGKLTWPIPTKPSTYRYIGRRLTVDDKGKTFLSPEFFPRLQVSLRKQFGRTCEIMKNMIKFIHDGRETIIEYSGSPAFDIDIMMRLNGNEKIIILDSLQRDIIKHILRLCAHPTLGCPGVKLVEYIMRPSCVEKLVPYRHRSEHQVVMVENLKQKVMRHGDLALKYDWPSEGEVLQMDCDDAKTLLGEQMSNDVLNQHMVDLKTIECQISKDEGSLNAMGNASLMGIPKALKPSGMTNIEEYFDQRFNRLEKTINDRFDILEKKMREIKLLQENLLPRVCRRLDELVTFTVEFQQHKYPRLPHFKKCQNRGFNRMVPGLRTFVLHLLCEHKDGFHVVEDQKGCEFPIGTESTQKFQTIVKWGLRVFTLLLKVGAHVGAGMSTVVPDLERIALLILDTPGIGLDELNLRVTQTLMDEVKPHLSHNDEVVAEQWLIDVLKDKCKGRDNIKSMFKLQKVRYKTEGKSKARDVAWICDKHYEEGRHRNTLELLLSNIDG